MYHIASGKTSFCALLAQFEQQALTLAQSAKPVCVGLSMTAENGALYLCFDCKLVDDHPKYEDPGEMDFAFVGEHGREASPMREWFQTATSDDDDSLVTEDGTVILHPVGSHVFSTPIFDAVCCWTDEFFRRPEAAFTPAWLIVDDMDAGLYRAWKLGELSIP